MLKAPIWVGIALWILNLVTGPYFLTFSEDIFDMISYRIFFKILQFPTPVFTAQSVY